MRHTPKRTDYKRYCEPSEETTHSTHRPSLDDSTQTTATQTQKLGHKKQLSRKGAQRSNLFQLLACCGWNMHTPSPFTDSVYVLPHCTHKNVSSCPKAFTASTIACAIGAKFRARVRDKKRYYTRYSHVVSHSSMVVSVMLSFFKPLKRIKMAGNFKPF